MPEVPEGFITFLLNLMKAASMDIQLELHVCKALITPETIIIFLCSED